MNNYKILAGVWFTIAIMTTLNFVVLGLAGDTINDLGRLFFASIAFGISLTKQLPSASTVPAPLSRTLKPCTPTMSMVCSNC